MRKHIWYNLNRIQKVMWGKQARTSRIYKEVVRDLQISNYMKNNSIKPYSICINVSVPSRFSLFDWHCFTNKDLFCDWMNAKTKHTVTS